MKTQTIEFDYGSYLVEVEATQDGIVISATLSMEYIDPIDGTKRFTQPEDCTKRFKESDFCMKELWKRIAEIDWSDHGDESTDSFRDMMGSVFRGESA